MSSIRALTVLIVVCLVCGCSSWRDWQMQKSVERSRSVALAKIDQEQCKAEGGVVRGVGMFGTPACVKPFQDAGKVCSDKSECRGLCMAPESSIVGSRSTGACQKDTHDIYGCYNNIESGAVVAGICLD
ncbi:hypothetical protein [Luteimonas fraxinea]|uniref:Secreted protein n=1 Tax=Luteimonas fraxinea TaxID=2901869 RepID=A0ABS8UDN3_9GAMM|nr:hypothetical protein [Luteimonas fraxinea]MCD9097102.1 hypothetical protein [Luteimonas fraxinea]